MERGDRRHQNVKAIVVQRVCEGNGEKQEGFGEYRPSLQNHYSTSLPTVAVLTDNPLASQRQHWLALL